jgi:hypothetical protein
MVFIIPNDEQIDFLTEQQKDILCTSISEYVLNYISDNRLSNKMKENIELDKYLNIKFNMRIKL